MLFTFITLTKELSAQAPKRLSYQAVVRNAASEIISEKSVSLKISILSGSVTGAAVFTETHQATTTKNGLVSLQIGAGTVQVGNITTIDWSAGNYFVKTEVDPDGGTNYSILSTSQLLSVPYSLSAAQADAISPNKEISLRNTTANSTLTLTPPGNGATGGLGTSSNHDLYFYTNNQDRVVFTAAGKYGFGTLAPSSPFHIASSNSEIRIENTSSNSSLYLTAPGVGSTGGIGLPTNQGLYFFTNNMDRAVISGAGNLGVGNFNPTSKVTVTGGDVNITDIGSGIIMKSPNGQCWRVTIGNTGTFSSTQITCP